MVGAARQGRPLCRSQRGRELHQRNGAHRHRCPRRRVRRVAGAVREL